MNDKLKVIVAAYQEVLNLLIDESSANFEGWTDYAKSCGYVKRIVKTSNDDRRGTEHMIEILSKRHSPFKDAKIRLEWFSCGNNTRSYLGKIVQNGVEVWCKSDLTQREISRLLEDYRDSLPLIVANLFGPDVWCNASFADLPIKYQLSWNDSVRYNVFYADARKSRSSGSIYIAKLPFETSYIHQLIIFYGVVFRETIVTWEETLSLEYIYDRRIGFIVKKKSEAKARELLGLPPIMLK